MATHKNTAKPNSKVRKAAPPSSRTGAAPTVEDRLTAFAELLGTTAGTIEGRAKGWMQSAQLGEQLAAVREHATRLLEQLGTSKAKTTKSDAPTRARAGRSGGTVDAPGKKHRKPPTSDPRAKSADTRISNLRTARMMRSAGRPRG